MKKFFKILCILCLAFNLQACRNGSPYMSYNGLIVDEEIRIPLGDTLQDVMKKLNLGDIDEIINNNQEKTDLGKVILKNDEFTASLNFKDHYVSGEDIYALTIFFYSPATEITLAFDNQEENVKKKTIKVIHIGGTLLDDMFPSDVDGEETQNDENQ